MTVEIVQQLLIRQKLNLVIYHRKTNGEFYRCLFKKDNKIDIFFSGKQGVISV